MVNSLHNSLNHSVIFQGVRQFFDFDIKSTHSSHIYLMVISCSVNLDKMSRFKLKIRGFIGCLHFSIQDLSHFKVIICKLFIMFAFLIKYYFNFIRSLQFWLSNCQLTMTSFKSHLRIEACPKIKVTLNSSYFCQHPLQVDVCFDPSPMEAVNVVKYLHKVSSKNYF